jgi:hypothetical protein
LLCCAGLAKIKMSIKIANIIDPQETAFVLRQKSKFAMEYIKM